MGRHHQGLSRPLTRHPNRGRRGRRIHHHSAPLLIPGSIDRRTSEFGTGVLLTLMGIAIASTPPFSIGAALFGGAMALLGLLMTGHSLSASPVKRREVHVVVTNNGGQEDADTHHELKPGVSFTPAADAKRHETSPTTGGGLQDEDVPSPAASKRMSNS